MVRHQKSSDFRVLLLVFLGGLLIRLLWQLQTVGSLTPFLWWGEASNVALALAEGRGFADSFYPGYGPTAHLLPLNALAASFWLWVFGPQSAAANLSLLALSLGQVGLGYWLLMRLCQRLGFAVPALRLGIILLCLFPIYVQMEIVSFRYWEGATAVCLMCFNMLRLLELDERAEIQSRDLIGIALLCAITAFVSLPVGFGVITCWGLFALRKLAWKQIAQLALAGAVALAMLLGPWAFRNHLVLGSPVLLRSNAGLELALANHPAAVSGEKPEAVFNARFLEIHPYAGIAARKALRSAGGEVNYSQNLGAATLSWIASNPSNFATLSLRHIRQFYFPDSWQFSPEPAGKPVQSSMWIKLISFLGLMSLFAGLLQGRRGFGMLASYFACVTLTYMFTQPFPRYTYLVYGLLLFVAADGCVRAWARVRRSWSKLSARHGAELQISKG